MNTTSPNAVPLPAKAPAVVGTKPGSEISVEKVLKLESVIVNLATLRAALLCVGKDETRYYLQGVHVHRTRDGFVRAVSTDGHRLLVANLYREALDKPGPAWLGVGVTIPADELAARLAIIDKSQDQIDKAMRAVRISFAVGSKKIELSDGDSSILFRVDALDGTFPDYDKLLGGFGGAFDDQQTGEFVPTSFNPAFLKSVGDVAARLASEKVTAYAMPDQVRETVKDGKTKIERNASPTIFTFGGKGVLLLVMPMKADEAMHAADRFVLAAPIKASLAALKAHETRNRTAAHKLTGPAKVEAIAKADAFKARMKDLVERAGNGVIAKALPTPPPAPAKIAAPAPAPKLNVVDGLGSGEALVKHAGLKPFVPVGTGPKSFEKLAAEAKAAGKPDTTLGGVVRQGARGAKKAKR